MKRDYIDYSCGIVCGLCGMWCISMVPNVVHIYGPLFVYKWYYISVCGNLYNYVHA